MCSILGFAWTPELHAHTNVSSDAGLPVAIYIRFARQRAALFALLYLVVLAVAAAVVPMALDYEYDTQDRSLSAVPSPPDRNHVLGTDALGQDVFARLFVGARLSLVVASAVVALQVCLGLVIGLAAGFGGRRADALLMSITDMMLALPTLLLVILLVAVLQPSTPVASAVVIVLALAATSWPTTARIVRGQALSLRERAWVESARALGLTEWRVVTRHVVPSLVGPILVAVTVGFGQTVLAEAGLSFLGLGIQPPFPSWGQMIEEGRSFVRVAPTLLVLPSLLLTSTVFAMSTLANALQGSTAGSRGSARRWSATPSSIGTPS